MNYKSNFRSIRKNYYAGDLVVGTSKFEGNAFEGVFSQVAKAQGFHLVRIPDGCRTIGKHGSTGIRIIRQKTPFDFVISKPGQCAFIDTKSVSAAAFTYSMLTDHQVTDMEPLGLHGFPAGYLVHFRNLAKVSFISAALLCTLRPKTTGLKPEDGILLGTSKDFDLNLIFKQVETP